MATGGGRVLPVGWDPSRTQAAESLDVLLVDDDEAVAGILLHALASRGYSTHWLQDGQEAAEALGEPNPSLRAKVVLLDIGLPSLDGLGLLRRIARDGVLRRTRVIMLTVRSSESEVLGSLELGAFDHVAKPFSIPVLMHRVRRALDA
jgi:DNA-binding response OmpR family regulator